MSGPHFRLELRPDELDRSARNLRLLARGLSDRSRATSRIAGGLAQLWKGPAATSAVQEVEGLSRIAHRAEAPVAAAATALDALAREQRHALEVDLPRLNRRWEEVAVSHRAAVEAAQTRQSESIAGVAKEADPAVRSFVTDLARGAAERDIAEAASSFRAQQQRLTAEFEQLREELRRHTRTTANRLAGATLVPVPVTTAQIAAAGGPLAALVTLVGVDAAEVLGKDMPLTALVDALKSPPKDLEALTALLDEARANGLPPTAFAEALKQFWTQKAYEAAGIDPAAWDTSLGAESLEAIIEQVYTYYGDAFLEDRDLQWSGMAAMIGPSFASGFLDLGMFREWAHSIGNAPLPPGISGDVVETLASLTDEDLGAYEERFLQMQKEIFLDQAPMHEAYRQGGIEGIREMVAAGLIDRRTAAAWEAIASGDPIRISQGNEFMLSREQREIIKNDYDWMYARPTGPAVTWAATLVGAPSIPDAKSFPEVFPIVVEQNTPGPDTIFGRDNPLDVTAVVTTPLPAGNIAHEDDRWALIEKDTLPRYRDVLGNGAQAEELIRIPVHERIEQYRLSKKWDDLIARIVSTTTVEVRQ